MKPKSKRIIAMFTAFIIFLISLAPANLVRAEIPIHGDVYFFYSDYDFDLFDFHGGEYVIWEIPRADYFYNFSTGGFSRLDDDREGSGRIPTDQERALQAALAAGGIFFQSHRDLQDFAWAIDDYLRDRFLPEPVSFTYRDLMHVIVNPSSVLPDISMDYQRLIDTGYYTTRMVLAYPEGALHALFDIAEGFINRFRNGTTEGHNVSLPFFISTPGLNLTFTPENIDRSQEVGVIWDLYRIHINANGFTNHAFLFTVRGAGPQISGSWYARGQGSNAGNMMVGPIAVNERGQTVNAGGVNIPWPSTTPLPSNPIMHNNQRLIVNPTFNITNNRPNVNNIINEITNIREGDTIINEGDTNYIFIVIPDNPADLLIPDMPEELPTDDPSIVGGDPRIRPPHVIIVNPLPPDHGRGPAGPQGPAGPPGPPGQPGQPAPTPPPLPPVDDSTDDPTDSYYAEAPTFVVPPPPIVIPPPIPPDDDNGGWFNFPSLSDILDGIRALIPDIITEGLRRINYVINHYLDYVIYNYLTVLFDFVYYIGDHIPNFMEYFPFSLPHDLANLVRAMTGNSPIDIVGMTRSEANEFLAMQAMHYEMYGFMPPGLIRPAPRIEINIPYPLNYTFVFDFADYPALIGLVRWSSLSFFAIGMIKLTPKVMLL